MERRAPSLLDRLIERLEFEASLSEGLPWTSEPRTPESHAPESPAAGDEPETEPAITSPDSADSQSPSRPEACRTLEELRTLCEMSDELRTDLEGTRLVFGSGDPNARLMIIGEAPGEEEDRQGLPFVGAAGALLTKILEAIDLTRDQVYIANILKHRPPGNRNPSADERNRSLPYLLRQIDLIDPPLILALGRVSATTLLEKESSLSSLRGRFHPFRGRELMATYHPAALLRNPEWKRPVWEDVQKLRRRYDELNTTN